MVMTEYDKMLVTLQNRINEGRNKGMKTTNIFISSLSTCMKMLKEYKKTLDNIVCFENGDRVRVFECPFCRVQYRIVIKGKEKQESN